MSVFVKNLNELLELGCAHDEIKKIKEFVEIELGFKIEKSFEKLDPKIKRSYFWVYASPKNKICPCPELGGEPSKMYTTFTWAFKKEEELKKAKLDTLFHEIEVYGSAKGCPITYDLLISSPLNRVHGVLHEGVHEYIRSNDFKISYCLEEPIAEYIAIIGAISYFEKTSPNHIPKVRELLWRTMNSATFVNKYYKRLTNCYEKGIGTRRQIIKKAVQEANKKGILYYCMNNAFFLMHYYYSNFQDLVFNEFGKRPIKDSMKNLKEIIKKLEKEIPPNALR